MPKIIETADAEEYTQALGQVCAGGYRQVALGERLGVPKALGLTTEEWVEDRLGGYVRLSIPERRQAVAELSEEGMSTREIGDVLGVDHSTVVRDAGANAPDEPEDEPEDWDEPEESGADAPLAPEDTDLGKQVLEMPKAKQRAAVKDFTAACLATSRLGPQMDNIVAGILAADIDARTSAENSLGVWKQVLTKLGAQSKIRRVK